MPQLTKIKLDEISFVDKPANKRRFLLFKREETNKEDERMTTLYNIFKSLMGDTKVEDAEKKLDELAKADKTMGDMLMAKWQTIQEYDKALPDDLKDAMRSVLKTAVDLMPAEKAETDTNDNAEGKKEDKKLPDDVAQELNTLVGGIVAAVNSILPDDQKIVKAEDKPLEQVQKSIEKLKEAIAGKTEKVEKKDDKDEGEVAKALKTVTDRLEKIEKVAGVSKKIEGDEDDKSKDKKKYIVKGEDGKVIGFNWLSLTEEVEETE